MAASPKPVDNLFWDASQVSDTDRQDLLRQQGAVLWFTGLSGSGKSTIARAVEMELIRRRQLAYVLDGDNVRHGLNAGLGFSPEDREENLRRISETGKLFADCGVLCITAFISPLRSARQRARDIVGANRFFEIFVSTPLNVCEQRDVKGLYQRARRGEVAEFTGISAPYEAPENPALTLDTSQLDLAQSVDQVIQLLQTRRILLLEDQ
jgi:adenylylsulfate kinase